MKRKKPDLLKKCDNLWRDIILLRAGYKSEINHMMCRKHGGDVVIQAHHIVKKPNYALRYDIENGICLTYYEHHYGIHGDREEEFRGKIKAVKGDGIYDRLTKKKYNTETLGAKSLHDYYTELKEILGAETL